MAIKLETTNPDEWGGTFAQAVGFVVADVLSDGEPFSARLKVTLESGGTRTILRQVTACVDGKISFSSPYAGGDVDVLDVVGLEVL